MTLMHSAAFRDYTWCQKERKEALEPEKPTYIRLKFLYRLVFLKQILSFSFNGYILCIYLSHWWIVGHLMPGNSPFEESRVGRWNLNHTKVFLIYLVLLNLWTQECANCVLSSKPWSLYWTRLIFLVYHAEPNKGRATKFVTESLYSGTSIKK